MPLCGALEIVLRNWVRGCRHLQGTQQAEMHFAQIDRSVRFSKYEYQLRHYVCQCAVAGYASSDEAELSITASRHRAQPHLPGGTGAKLERGAVMFFCRLGLRLCVVVIKFYSDTLI